MRLTPPAPRVADRRSSNPHVVISPPAVLANGPGGASRSGHPAWRGGDDASGFVSNRELFASMAFEDDDEKDRGAKENRHEPTSSDDAGESPPPTSSSADEAHMIIYCMKVALAKAISSISVREKERPLDPETDFTYKARMVFEPGTHGAVDNRIGARRHNMTSKRTTRGFLCCSGTDRAVERRPPTAQQPDATAGGSDDDAAGAPPVLQGPHAGTTAEEAEEKRAAALASLSFTFADYAPMCYRHIRKFLGVDATMLKDVLCGSTWHHIPSPGKSSAQLFFCGQNWVIKTMTPQESTFLRSILHRYYYHVRDNPHSLLPHFVGQYSLCVMDAAAPLAKLNKMSFIVMKNVFATPNKIHEKYDLKGSTVGRFASKREQLKMTCTKKDLDLSRPLFIGPQRKKVFVDQMRRDCDFLERAGVMDYSLLVGIHTPARDAVHATLMPRSPYDAALGHDDGSLKDHVTGLPPTAATGGSGGVALLAGDGAAVAGSLSGTCFTADQGGMLSSPPPGWHLPNPASGGSRVMAAVEIYYIGIIDILQEYNWWKRSENLFRGMVHDRHQISCVDPKEYASRFVQFISSGLA